MTREELIAQMAADAKTTKVQAKAALDSFIDAVTKTLKKGGRLSLVGFGTFTVSKRSARTGRNPKTGEPLQIKARKVAKFKAGSSLSKAVNGNK
jgi:DNA-binding protein HU-beta